MFIKWRALIRMTHNKEHGGFQVLSGDYEEYHLLGCDATCLHAGILLSLFFNPEDGGDMFLQIVGWLSRDYMALYHRRQYSSENMELSRVLEKGRPQTNM
jgi:hypothetical protein